jgi:hypothetical protein
MKAKEAARCAPSAPPAQRTGAIRRVPNASPLAAGAASMRAGAAASGQQWRSRYGRGTVAADGETYPREPAPPPVRPPGPCHGPSQMHPHLPHTHTHARPPSHKTRPRTHPANPAPPGLTPFASSMRPSSKGKSSCAPPAARWATPRSSPPSKSWQSSGGTLSRAMRRVGAAGGRRAGAGAARLSLGLGRLGPALGGWGGAAWGLSRSHTCAPGHTSCAPLPRPPRRPPGGRDDLVAKEQAELALLESYLPAQLSEAELRGIVAAAVAEVGAAGDAGCRGRARFQAG